jgi:hypothetical protein
MPDPDRTAFLDALACAWPWREERSAAQKPVLFWNRLFVVRGTVRRNGLRHRNWRFRFRIASFLCRRGLRGTGTAATADLGRCKLVYTWRGSISLVTGCNQ